MRLAWLLPTSLICVLIQPHVSDTRGCALLHDRKNRGQTMLVPSPKWLDSGNNAWQLAAATFVGLQSIPGLAVLYAGYVKQKWAINSAFMCFYAFASVLVVWVLFDYNMAFGEQWFPFLGKPALATSATFITGQAVIPAAASGMPELTFPMATLMFFQFVFAAITVIILGGSVLGRMNFSVGDLLPGVDDPGLYRRGVQPVGRWLALTAGRTGFFRRLRHPSRRRHVRLRRRRGGRAPPADRSRTIPAQ